MGNAMWWVFSDWGFEPWLVYYRPFPSKGNKVGQLMSIAHEQNKFYLRMALNLSLRGEFGGLRCQRLAARKCPLPPSATFSSKAPPWHRVGGGLGLGDEVREATVQWHSMKNEHRRAGRRLVLWSDHTQHLTKSKRRRLRQRLCIYESCWPWSRHFTPVSVF